VAACHQHLKKELGIRRANSETKRKGTFSKKLEED
jgi:hypothetical protein